MHEAVLLSISTLRTFSAKVDIALLTQTYIPVLFPTLGPIRSFYQLRNHPSLRRILALEDHMYYTQHGFSFVVYFTM
jgi:hypothetical protein